MAQQHKLGKTNTHIAPHGNNTYVTYCDTAVVSFDDQMVRLRTGGWYSATTARRMNQASSQFGLEYSVSRKRGDYYVTVGGETHKFGEGGWFAFFRPSYLATLRPLVPPASMELMTPSAVNASNVAS